MVLKKLYLIIPILLVLLSGCGKDVALKDRKQDNYNNNGSVENAGKTLKREMQYNGYGNLINGGYAVYDDGYIFFTNGFDIGETTDGKLYRVKSDWTEPIKILDDNAVGINIVGDWIFYINGSDGYKLYKARKDGTQRMMLHDEKCESLYVQGDWIYYSTRFVVDDELKGEIYKMKIDGSNKEKLNDDFALNLVVQDEWIYYSNYKRTMGYLYKMKTDGTKKSKISDEAICRFILCDQWIYYTDAKDKMYRMDIKGKNKSIITEDDIFYFNTDGKWIYYSNISDSEKLYKIKLDGSGREKLNEISSPYVHIVGDWIYYIYSYKDTIIPCRIKLDGSEEACADPNQNQSVEDKETKDSANDSGGNFPKVLLNAGKFGEKALYLGMPIEEVRRILNVIDEEPNEIERTSHPYDWKFGNKIIQMRDYSIEFDREEKVYEIYVTDKIPTERGLKFGDSIEKMEVLYGKNYKKESVDGETYFSYDMGEYKFWGYFNAENQLDLWVLTVKRDIDAELQTWEGVLKYSEFASPDQNVIYTIEIHKENNEFYGDISIDGFQTKQRIRTKAVGDKTAIYLVFESYLPSNIQETYGEGDILLKLERKDSKVYTTWFILKPILLENKDNQGVYFEF
jgi:hypothetical protein